jgi:hypothetical protein
VSRWNEVTKWLVRGGKLLGWIGNALTAYDIGTDVYDFLKRPNPFGPSGPRPPVIYDEDRNGLWRRQPDGSYQFDASVGIE